MIVSSRGLRGVFTAFAAAVTISVAGASMAKAVTLEEDSAGVLTGARDVLVDGHYYDVTFTNGSCDSLFDGCKAENLVLKTEEIARAAAEALLDQVFIGKYETATDSVNGCTLKVGCYTRIAYQGVTNGEVNMMTVYNAGTNPVGDVILDELIPTSVVTSFPNVNMAVFSRSTELPAVPAPEPFILVLSGMALLLARKRFA